MAARPYDACAAAIARLTAVVHGRSDLTSNPTELTQLEQGVIDAMDRLPASTPTFSPAKQGVVIDAVLAALAELADPRHARGDDWVIIMDAMLRPWVRMREILADTGDQPYKRELAAFLQQRGECAPRPGMRLPASGFLPCSPCLIQSTSEPRTGARVALLARSPAWGPERPPGSQT
jgi:hypothetical protein